MQLVRCFYGYLDVFINSSVGFTISIFWVDQSTEIKDRQESHLIHIDLTISRLRSRAFGFEY